MSKRIDITNQRFGKLVAIRPVGHNARGEGLWLCRCDCGNTIEVVTYSLRSGNTQSCGCMAKEVLLKRNTKHGKCGTRLYRIYRGMVQRCTYPKHKNYAQYGGKGVKICDEWLEYSAFEQWAKNNGYSDTLSIDRINVDGDYSPTNCRWVDVYTQAHNKSNNNKLTYNGETLTIAEWARKLNLRTGTLRYRIKRGLPNDLIFKAK